MSKDSFFTASLLRSQASRFKGPVLLVCHKCERRLRHSGKHGGAGHLNRSLKELSGQDPDGRRVHVIPIDCLKLCPEDGVTVCTQADLLENPPTLTVIRTREEIAALYQQCTLPLRTPEPIVEAVPQIASAKISSSEATPR